MAANKESKSKKAHRHSAGASAPQNASFTSESTRRKEHKKQKERVHDAPLDSPFKQVQARLRLSLPPIFVHNIIKGAREMLDSLVMRYSPALGAVLLAYHDLAFDDDSAEILDDCPFLICDISFTAIVWSPQIGHRLTGTHSISSESHISLILYKTFNVSIPIDRIPLDKYVFDENRAGGRPDGQEEADSDSEDEDFVEETSTGRWVEKATGKVLGDGEDIVFTVIGKQVSSQMLSLTGSLMGFETSGAHATEPLPIAPGTQIARAPPATQQPEAAALPSESFVAEPATKAKKSKKNADASTTTIGVDVASSAQVDHALHEANPGPQPVDPFAAMTSQLSADPSAATTAGMTAEEAKKLKKAERRKKKEAQKAQARQISGDAPPAPDADAEDDDESNPKEEGYFPAENIPVKSSKSKKDSTTKSKRSADDANLSLLDASKKRKKAA